MGVVAAHARTQDAGSQREARIGAQMTEVHADAFGCAEIDGADRERKPIAGTSTDLAVEFVTKPGGAQAAGEIVLAREQLTDSSGSIRQSAISAAYDSAVQSVSVRSRGGATNPAIRRPASAFGRRTGAAAA